MKELEICTFVIPIHIDENNIEKLEYFKQAINSILNQTCHEWSMVLVNDNSNNRILDEHINQVIAQQKQTIIYHKNGSRMGAGFSRNIGIEIARELGCEIILFQDADDISHHKRVEVTKEVIKTQNVDVVYSPFIPIDEQGNKIAPEKLPNNIKTLMENNNNPTVGKDVWKIIASKEIYINLTSTTSVRIDVARKVPFPNIRSSEDLYTWMLYSANGAIFQCINEIPSKYRIPQNVKHSSLSTSMGEEIFYQEFAEAYIKAFFECTKVALARGTISNEEINKMTPIVFTNLFNELKGAGMHKLADKYLYRDLITNDKF